MELSLQDVRELEVTLRRYSRYVSVKMQESEMNIRDLFYYICHMQTTKTRKLVGWSSAIDLWLVSNEFVDPWTLEGEIMESNMDDIDAFKLLITYLDEPKLRETLRRAICWRNFKAIALLLEHIPDPDISILDCDTEMIEFFRGRNVTLLTTAEDRTRLGEETILLLDNKIRNLFPCHDFGRPVLTEMQIIGMMRRMKSEYLTKLITKYRLCEWASQCCVFKTEVMSLSQSDMLEIITRSLIDGIGYHFVKDKHPDLDDDTVYDLVREHTRKIDISSYLKNV